MPNSHTNVYFSTFAAQIYKKSQTEEKMKKKIFCLIFVGFTILHFQAVGQINKNTIKKINGLEFYIYTVEESEGLLAIGRKFEVSIDEISKFNPIIKSGLKPGQQLLIPVVKKSGNNQIQNFIHHKVENKQTLFAISRKYDISQHEIEEYNPELKNGLKEGMILNIPRKTILEANSKTEQKTVAQSIKSSELTLDNRNSSLNYTIHKVLSGETLFSICKQYNIDIKDVVNLNPGVDIKLLENSDLKIPIVSQNKNSKFQSNGHVEIGSTSTTIPSKSFEKHNALDKSLEQRTFKIAFLLPFMLDQIKKDPGLERFQHFYSGALLAILKAKEEGNSIDIFTYDTENSEEKLTEVLNNPDLKTVDLIIGPAFSNHVPLVSSFAKENKINTLIPFSAKVSDIDDNPYIFQFNPGSDTESKYFSELIFDKFNNTNIVFANVPGINSTDEGKTRSDYLINQLIKENRTFSQIELSSPETATFSNTIKKGIKNLIIFNSDKLVNINAYINILRTYTGDFDIVIFEQFNWKNQIDKFPQSIYISPFKQNFDPITSNDFNALFDQYYGKDVSNVSPRFDLLGYDLTWFFINAYKKYGTKFGSKFELSFPFEGIQSEPVFKRISNESGFINQQVYMGEDKIIQ